MKSFTSPPKASTNRTNGTTQRKSQPGKPMTDNRPTTVTQRTLQQVANGSPRVLQAKGIGRGLPDELKAGVEALSGYSLDDVRVHYNSSKPAEVGALAYAQGTDIYLAPGQEKHLAHEAWHVVQQKQGRVRPTTELDGGVAINDNVGLEMEAERMGQQSVNQNQRPPSDLLGLSMGVVSQSRSIIQAFGIHDLNWNDATSVEHLSKAAYVIKGRDNGSVVLKYHPGNGFGYDSGAGESPLTEAVAANFGEVFGVRTANTILINAKDQEGQKIISCLERIEGSDKLSAILKQKEAFLVMEHIDGVPFSKVGSLRNQFSDAQLANIFEQIGRLWVFDLFTDNTDRFFQTNLGNLLVDQDGAVYGIDQQLFEGATSFGKVNSVPIGTLKAEGRLESILNPGKRKKNTKELFNSLKEGGLKDLDFLSFNVHFEKGVLRALVDAGKVQDDQLAATLSRLPGFATEAAQTMGIDGMIDVLELVKTKATDVEILLEQLNSDINFMHSAIPALTPVAQEREALLDYFSKQVAQLSIIYDEVSKKYVGKQKYWQDKKQELEKISFFNEEQYKDVLLSTYARLTASEQDDFIITHINAWSEKLVRIRQQFQNLTKGIKDTTEIKDRLAILEKLIVDENNYMSKVL